MGCIAKIKFSRNMSKHYRKKHAQFIPAATPSYHNSNTRNFDGANSDVVPLESFKRLRKLQQKPPPPSAPLPKSSSSANKLGSPACKFAPTSLSIMWWGTFVLPVL